MGVGIINCFMIVLAFVAMPLLVHDYSTSDFRGKNATNNHQLEPLKQNNLNSNLDKSPSVIHTYH
jgi:hypothetical protein